MQCSVISVGSGSPEQVLLVLFMDIRVEQGCPQCGAGLDLGETDRILTCEYCGVKSYLQLPRGEAFRYVLPPRVRPPDDAACLLVPYLRFKGTIYLVTPKKIIHRVVDTTRIAVHEEGLPPSLGVRPQAMQLRRVEASMRAGYMLRSLDPLAVLEKAVQVSGLQAGKGQGMIHRAFIGETISVIYLPLVKKGGHFIDAVSQSRVRFSPAENESSRPRITTFRPQWKVNYLSTLCPHCGWSLEGSVDTTVMHCENCHRAWDITGSQIHEVRWFVQRKICGSLMLPFWRLSGSIPAMNIRSFSDFVQCTGQFVSMPGSAGSADMALLVPGFKIRPKVFIRTGCRATLSQHNLRLETGRKESDFHPVTMPAEEARQSVKLLLAAAAVNKKMVYPLLSRAKLVNPTIELLYLRFDDRGHDWFQPDTGIAIAKNVLVFGRSM